MVPFHMSSNRVLKLTSITSCMVGETRSGTPAGSSASSNDVIIVIKSENSNKIKF